MLNHHTHIQVLPDFWPYSASNEDEKKKAALFFYYYSVPHIAQIVRKLESECKVSRDACP